MATRPGTIHSTITSTRMSASSPPREYVSMSAVSTTASPPLEMSRSVVVAPRRPAHHRIPGTAITATSASAFQYPIGACRREGS